jgi:hypothetical protein
MLLIGSRALVANNPELEGVRRTVDWDFICTIEQFTAWHKANKDKLQFAVPTQSGKYYHARDKDGMNYEFELAWEGTSAEMLLEGYGIKKDLNIEPAIAINEDLLLIKMCHRYKRNSPHFLKTMKDIHFLRSKMKEGEYEKWVSLINNKYIVEQREAESYNYAHPKLNVSSKDFFNGDGVNYVYDHDSIHEAVALMQTDNGYECKPRPAYTMYMRENSEVMTCKERFLSPLMDEKVRLYGVYEESCVLALERSQIPHGLGKEGGPSARWSFEMALMKVATSITSGWFREFAWENYDKVMTLYEELGERDYIDRFERNRHLLREYSV